jgi:hypothetical protein
MKLDRLARLAPLSGVAAAAMLAVGAALSARGGYFPAAGEVHDYITTDSGPILAGTVIGGFYGVVALIWFAGNVASALRRVEKDGQRLATTAFGGALVAATGLAVSSAILWVAAARVDRPGGVTVTEAVVLYDVQSSIAAWVVSVGFALFTGATGLAALRAGVYPTWFGWASLAMAAGLLTPIHWIFLGLTFLWLVAASVLLYRHRIAGHDETARTIAAQAPSVAR